ncbi:MAG: Double zinc ribbon [Blastocatellia bacterium]
MKTCPECGIALKDEYQFCPEDGASLDESASAAPIEATAAAKPQTAGAVVLYCPACAAEYPLTFSECPVHHTALTAHGISSSFEAPRAQDKAEAATAEDARDARRLHLVSSEAQSRPMSSERQPRRSGIEEYEQALESLAQPAAAPAVADNAGDQNELPASAPVAAIVEQDEGRKYRLAAIVISVALGLLALIGIYTVISNAARKPVQPSTKNTSAKNNSAPPAITVQTPQSAVDYQEQAAANVAQPTVRDAANAPRSEVAGDAQIKTRRSLEPADTQPQRAVDARTFPAPREPGAAQPTRPVQPVTAAPATLRQPAATELVLPRGTFGLVDARLTSVRASRTAGGYRYDLTFHMADQAGHATQWERMAIVTRAASGASRQQQIPFYHRLGADGSLSFTVSVEMPGRAPADWQGRIICTSVGSDSSGKTYRASFGANVSPH